jgi:hypothetical protein
MTKPDHFREVKSCSNCNHLYQTLGYITIFGKNTLAMVGFCDLYNLKISHNIPEKPCICDDWKDTEEIEMDSERFGERCDNCREYDEETYSCKAKKRKHECDIKCDDWRDKDDKA